MASSRPSFNRPTLDSEDLAIVANSGGFGQWPFHVDPLLNGWAFPPATGMRREALWNSIAVHDTPRHLEWR